MSLIKTDKEIEQLNKDGSILADILWQVIKKIKPGIMSKELDEYAEQLIRQAGGEPAFKGYGDELPFPGTLCISFNEEVVHGIPSDRVVKAGDVISLDVGMKKNGLFTDMATTVGVGHIDSATKKLLKVTNKSLELAIKQCKVGKTLGDIGYAVQAYVERNGFNVVRDLVGHGVGHAVHEAPSVPNYGRPGQGTKLEAGMVLAIEPMVTMGGYDIDYLDDNWTIKTLDNSLSAHFEHTIAITKKGPIVITKL